jgi:hypothetical protein
VLEAGDAHLGRDGRPAPLVRAGERRTADSQDPHVAEGGTEAAVHDQRHGKVAPRVGPCP